MDLFEFCAIFYFTVAFTMFAFIYAARMTGLLQAPPEVSDSHADRFWMSLGMGLTWPYFIFLVLRGRPDEAGF